MRRAGFTLVEMVVAMTIALLALAAVYQVFRAAQRSVLLAEGMDQRLHASRRALRLLSDDLDSLHLLNVQTGTTEAAMSTSSEEQPQFTFAAEDGQDVRGGLALDSLRFTTSSNDPRFQPYPAARLVEVLYYIDQDEATTEEGLVRQVNYWPNLLPAELQVAEEDLPRAEVAPEVRGLSLRFLDDESDPETGGEWVEVWDYTDRLPAAIEITFSVAWDIDQDTGEVLRWVQLPAVVPLLRRAVLTPPVMEEAEAAGAAGMMPETAGGLPGQGGQTPLTPGGQGGGR